MHRATHVSLLKTDGSYSNLQQILCRFSIRSVSQSSEVSTVIIPPAEQQIYRSSIPAKSKIFILPSQQPHQL